MSLNEFLGDSGEYSDLSGFCVVNRYVFQLWDHGPTRWTLSPLHVSPKLFSTLIHRLIPGVASGRADDDRSRQGDRRRDDFLSSRCRCWNLV